MDNIIPFQPTKRNISVLPASRKIKPCSSSVKRQDPTCIAKAPMAWWIDKLGNPTDYLSKGN